MPTRSCVSPGVGRRLGKAQGKPSPLARMALWDSDAPLLTTSSLPTDICELLASPLALPPSLTSGAIDFEVLLSATNTFRTLYPDGPRAARSRPSERGGTPGDPEHTCEVTISPRTRLQGSKSNSDLTAAFHVVGVRRSPSTSPLGRSSNHPPAKEDGAWMDGGGGGGGCFGALGAQMAAMDESYSLLSWCGTDGLPALHQKDSYIAESESLECEVFLPLAHSVDFSAHSPIPQTSFRGPSPPHSVSPVTNVGSPVTSLPGSPYLSHPPTPSLEMSQPTSPAPAPTSPMPEFSAAAREDCRWSAMVPVAMSMLTAHMPVEKVMEQLMHYDNFIAATQLAIRNTAILQLDPAESGPPRSSDHTQVMCNLPAIRGYGFSVGLSNQSCCYSLLGRPLGAVLLRLHARELSHAAHKLSLASADPTQTLEILTTPRKGGKRVKASSKSPSSLNATLQTSTCNSGSSFARMGLVNFESTAICVDLEPNTGSTNPHLTAFVQQLPLQHSRYMPATVSDTLAPLPASQQLPASMAAITTPTLTTSAAGYPLQRPPRPTTHTALAHVGDTNLVAHTITATALGQLPPTSVTHTPGDDSSSLTLPSTTRASGSGAARTSSQGGSGSTGRPSHCGSGTPHDLDHDGNEDSDEKSDDRDEGVMWGRVEEEEEGEDAGHVDVVDVVRVHQNMGGSSASA